MMDWLLNSKHCCQEKDLYDYCSQKRINGESIVLVNGTFDVLHPGHIYLLNEASRLADVLLVLINSDESIKILKGENKPIISLEYRLYCLASLSCVDKIFSFNEPRITRYLNNIKPNIWVKGSDYIDNVEKSEKDIADSLNIEIKFVERLAGFSSSKMIKDIKNIY